MKSDLIKKIESLPEDFQKEVEHFVDFLTTKTTEDSTMARTRKAGFAKGIFVIKEGFDDPLHDFKDYQ